MTAVEGWKTNRLDEIGSIFSGSTPSTSIHSFWDGDIVWVTPNDLSKLNTPYLHDSAKRITEKGISGCSSHLLPAGSLVMSSRAPIGYVAIPTVEFCTNQGCKSIKLKDAFHSEFTYYNVLFNIHKIKSLGEGTTFAEISKTALSSIKLPFPVSVTEQTKIAEILSTVDRAIEQTEALIAKQQRIKTGLMQDLLTRGIDEHGNLRTEQTHKFKDTPLGRIPMEWEVATLQSMASKDKHSIVDGPFGSNLKMIHYRDSGVPIIQSGFVTRGVFAASNYLYVDESKFKSEIRSKAVPGDIVMAKIGARCGMSSMLPDNHPISIIAGNCIKVTVSEENSNKYVLACLQHKYSITHFEDIISTTAQPAVNMPTLKVILLKKPKLTEQLLIVECFEKSQSEVEVQERSLTKFRSLKTALMQDLLMGKKRVAPLLKELESQIS